MAQNYVSSLNTLTASPINIGTSPARTAATTSSVTTRSVISATSTGPYAGTRGVSPVSQVYRPTTTSTQATSLGLSTLPSSRVVATGSLETVPRVISSIGTDNLNRTQPISTGVPIVRSVLPTIPTTTYAGANVIRASPATTITSSPTVIQAANTFSLGTTVLSTVNTSNMTLEKASDDRETFVAFIKKAVSGKHTPEYRELYSYMQDAFTSADGDFDGLISPVDFDILVEHAMALPAKLGLAPTSVEMYESLEHRMNSRQQLFQQINVSNSGTLHFDEWLQWGFEHLVGKAQLLDQNTMKSKMLTNAEDFTQFLISACSNRGSLEYKELYGFLLSCFTAADQDMDGRVSPLEFDRMIETAGAAPRKFGFAPSTQDMFPTDDLRIQARTQMFATMDTDNNGTITFDEWLNFCYNHIVEKTRSLDPTLGGTIAQ